MGLTACFWQTTSPGSFSGTTILKNDQKTLGTRLIFGGNGGNNTCFYVLPCEEGNRKHKFLVQKIGFLPNFSETLVALNFLYKNPTERLSTRRHALMKRSALWDTFASPLSYRPHMLPLKSGHRTAVISDCSAGNIENRSMLCYAMLSLVMSCHVMSCHVMLCYGRF